MSEIRKDIPENHLCQHCGEPAKPKEWIDVLPINQELLDFKVGRGLKHVCSKCKKETALLRECK